MRAPLGFILAGTLLLVACQTPTQRESRKGSPAPLQGGASASPSLKPSAPSQASVAPSPQTVASSGPNLLGKPAGAVSTLNGQIRIDASYIISAGAGNIISTNAGAIISAGAGNIISGGAGNIISGGAGNIISGGAGNIISGGAGNIISGGAGNYVLLQAAASTAPAPASTAPASSVPVAKGAQLPAANMEISVRSLITGQLLPVGVDKAHNDAPVYTVLSNAAGEYTVYIPESENGNVLVEANVPASQDPKLQYALFASTRTEASQLLDEDTAMVTEYITQAFVGRLEAILSKPLGETLGVILYQWAAPCEISRRLALEMKALRVQGDAVGLAEAPAVDVHRIADRAARVLIQGIELDTIMVDPAAGGMRDAATVTSEKYPGDRYVDVEPALKAMTEIMGYYRQQTQIRLDSSPTYFKSAPYMLAANACKAPTEQFAIERGSDIGEFWVREYLSQVRDDVFNLIGVTVEAIDNGYLGPTQSLPPARRRHQISRMNAAGATFGAEFGKVLFADEAAKAKVMAVIGAYQPNQSPAPGEPPVVLWPKNCLSPRPAPSIAPNGEAATDILICE